MPLTLTHFLGTRAMWQHPLPTRRYAGDRGGVDDDRRRDYGTGDLSVIEQHLGDMASIGRFEALSFDQVADPALPVVDRPASLLDEQVIRRAVDEGEEGVDGAAPIDA